MGGKCSWVEWDLRSNLLEGSCYQMVYLVGCCSGGSAGNGADVQLKGGKTQEAALHIAARIDEAKEGFFLHVETSWDKLRYWQECVKLRFYTVHYTYTILHILYLQIVHWIYEKIVQPIVPSNKIHTRIAQKRKNLNKVAVSFLTSRYYSVLTTTWSKEGREIC